MLLYPSLMGADQLRLAEIIAQLEPYCAGFHLDNMDGHLVPNITGGPTWTNAISAFTKKPVWAHLMVTDPTLWIPQLQLPSNSMIDFQYEAQQSDHNATLHMIRNKGHKAGISIAPDTTLESIAPLLPQCDYLVVMGVNPGFAGQLFLPHTIEKITIFNIYRKKHALSFFIACDGGITEQLLPTLKTQGVSHAAISSALFTAHDPVMFLRQYNN